MCTERSFSRRRESSQLNHSREARQYLGVARFAVALSCWIPACARMTSNGSGQLAAIAVVLFLSLRCEVVTICDNLAKTA